MTPIMTSSAEDEDVFTGIPSSYEDMYQSFLFLLSVYLAGDVLCRRVLRVVPPLAGQLLLGVLAGPGGFDLVPNPSFWILLGNLGLMLMLLQSGLQSDMDLLLLVGPICGLISVVGTLLPIGIGVGVGFALGLEWKEALAAGCTFGPTSAGLVSGALSQCDVVDRPVGQLLVAVTTVDGIIALLILSLLPLLTGELSRTDIIVISASPLAWIILGVTVALTVFPGLKKRTLDIWEGASERMRPEKRPKGPAELEMERTRKELILLVAMLLALVPAVHKSRGSLLIGAFLAGLGFCRSDKLNDYFLEQFKRVSYWLVRIFFAATIGFQVPMEKFCHTQVLLFGLAYTLPIILGKMVVGPLFTPNFYADKHVFNARHVRDCLVASFGFASEAGLALMLGVYSVTNDLITDKTFASVVLAIILSAVVGPLGVKLVVARFPFLNDDTDYRRHASLVWGSQLRFRRISTASNDSAGATNTEETTSSRLRHESSSTRMRLRARSSTHGF